MADQLGLWLARTLPRGELKGPHDAARFAELYREYRQHAAHVAPPHWKAVLLMMVRHRLVCGISAKGKTLDGWAASPLLLAACADEDGPGASPE